MWHLEPGQLWSLEMQSLHYLWVVEYTSVSCELSYQESLCIGSAHLGVMVCKAETLTLGKSGQGNVQW